MSVPTLKHLASVQIAKNIAEDIPMTPGFTLPAELADTVFAKSLAESSYESVESCSNLLLNRAELQDLVVFEDLMRVVRKQDNLRKLNLKEAKFPEEYYDEEENGELTLKIVEILKNMTNSASRQSIRHLDISGEEKFPEGWENEVGKLLPNLEALVMQGREIGTFAPKFELFQNLKILDVTLAISDDWEGIGALSNLEVLIMKSVELETVDFGKLEKLRVLDVSNVMMEPEARNIENLLKNCKKPLENLQFIDCKFTDINLEMFRELLKRFPNLKQISLIETALNDQDLDEEISGNSQIKILNCATLESSLECLKWQKNEIFYSEHKTVLSWIQNRMNPSNSWLVAEHTEQICELIEANFSMVDVVEKASRILKDLHCSEHLDMLQTQRALKSYLHFCSKSTDDVDEAGEVHLNFWTILWSPQILEHLGEFQDLDFLKLIAVGSEILSEDVEEFFEQEFQIVEVFQKIAELPRHQESTQLIRRMTMSYSKIVKANSWLLAESQQFLNAMKELETSIRSTPAFRILFLKRKAPEESR